MADNLIPEPQIQATNIPTGGGAQVRFDFVAPDNPFANLSKTIASASQTLVNFNQLEENERKAQEAFQENLKQIHGLTETGQLSQADYMKIQREANAKAQREGIIGAHENWSTITETQKQRSNIRIKALSSALETTGAIDRMSNPNEGLASTWDQEYNGLLESMATESMGTDTQGNEVYLDLDNMTPMEMVAFAQGQSALEAATKLAVEENKHNRQIEASTATMESDLFDAFENLALLNDVSIVEQALTAGGASVENIKEQRRKTILAQIEDTINIGYNAGVKDINNHIIESIKSLASQELAVADASKEDGLSSFNKLLDTIEGDLMLRDGVRFAEKGTANFNKVETIRKSTESSFATARKNYEKNLEGNKNILQLEIDAGLIAIADAKEAGKDVESEQDFRLRMRKRAHKLKVPFTYDERINNFYKGQKVDVEVDAERLRNSANNVRNGNISKYEEYKKEVNKLFIDGHLTYPEFRTEIDKLDSRLEEYNEEQITNAELIKGKGVDVFDEQKIHSSVQGILRGFHGMPYDTDSYLIVPNADVLEVANDLAISLRESVITGTTVPKFGEEISKEFELADFQRLSVPLRANLQSDIDRLQEGFTEKEWKDMSVNQRNRKAAQYLRSYMRVSSAIAASQTLIGDAITTLLPNTAPNSIFILQDEDK